MGVGTCTGDSSFFVTIDKNTTLTKIGRMLQKRSGQIKRKGGGADRGCFLNTLKQKDMTDKTGLIGGWGWGGY